MNYLSEPFLIDGQWRAASGARFGVVNNPATGLQIGKLPFAEKAELSAALLAAQKGFEAWRVVPAFERYQVLRRAADLVRARTEEIANSITLEQGKPLGEARIEVVGAAGHIDWYAEECRRSYGRIIPSRAANVSQWVVKEPVGPVAAFTPWNFPVSQLVRKIAGALAAGCSIIVKPPEDTPSSCIALCRAIEDAGLPAGALNVVFGVPHEVSEYLLASDIIKKVSFTGSVPVGRRLAALAGQGLKRITLELGGHAPFIVTDDADVGLAAQMAATLKFRNAGQVCVSPTRFYVQAGVYDAFMEKFVALTSAITLGDGFKETTRMGPLVSAKRVKAVDEFVQDAIGAGAKLLHGGAATAESGFFYQPTIFADLPSSAKVMCEEPFGPIAAVNKFKDLSEAVSAANSLPYALAAFVFCRLAANCALFANKIEAGMVSINGFGLAAPETPFGGIKDSGYGSEGGSEGLEAYLAVKFVSQTV
ncbi:MAG: NAD-dependent succinate-semialdehyde dehydrogenase [Rhodospirillaceae bacterium]